MSYTIRKNVNLDEAKQLELYEQGVRNITTEYQSIALLAKIVLRVIEKNNLKVSDKDLNILIELVKNRGFLTDDFIKCFTEINDEK